VVEALGALQLTIVTASFSGENFLECALI